VAGRIRSIKISSDLIAIRSRDLPACRIVSQPTTLPREGITPCIFKLGTRWRLGASFTLQPLYRVKFRWSPVYRTPEAVVSKLRSCPYCGSNCIPVACHYTDFTLSAPSFAFNVTDHALASTEWVVVHESLPRAW
jgi:hypothetical protein